MPQKQRYMNNVIKSDAISTERNQNFKMCVPVLNHYGCLMGLYWGYNGGILGVSDKICKKRTSLVWFLN